MLETAIWKSIFTTYLTIFWWNFALLLRQRSKCVCHNFIQFNWNMAIYRVTCYGLVIPDTRWSSATAVQRIVHVRIQRMVFDGTQCRWRNNGWMWTAELGLGRRTQARAVARRCLQTRRGWSLRSALLRVASREMMSCSGSNHQRSSSTHSRCQLSVPKGRFVSDRLTNCAAKTVPNACIV